MTGSSDTLVTIILDLILVPGTALTWSSAEPPDSKLTSRPPLCVNKAAWCRYSNLWSSLVLCSSVAQCSSKDRSPCPTCRVSHARHSHLDHLTGAGTAAALPSDSSSQSSVAMMTATVTATVMKFPLVDRTFPNPELPRLPSWRRPRREGFGGSRVAGDGLCWRTRGRLGSGPER